MVHALKNSNDREKPNNRKGKSGAPESRENVVCP